MRKDERDTELEADSSGYILGGCLSNNDNSGIFKPFTCLSKTLTPAEVNYDIHDEELLSIVCYMDE